MAVAGRAWLLPARGAALAAALAAGSPASCEETALVRRGPIERRDGWLLAQGRLTLPAVSPDTLAPGETRVRASLDWGNDFGWRPGPSGTPNDVAYIVDGEHGRLDLEVRRGLGPGWDAGIRVPVLWRGGGFLDDVIDAWHGVTTRLGLPDNDRSDFPTDRLRVEGHDGDGRPVAWPGRSGAGLGRLEVDARWAPVRPVDGRGWTAAVVGRVAAPTGTGPFTGTGLEAGAQLVAARGLGSAFDVYAGAGATASSTRRAAGLDYARHRAHGFLVLEWRPARRLSLLVETSAASRLVTSLADYPALVSYLRIGAQLDVGARWRLEGGFTENLAHQQATTDFGVFLGVASR
ncbi:MAG: DUF3187 family protein [Acidobacteria bacterium]|nr:DUF3187 family protein [Acidobacteriota bacterium]